jgi:putative ABC transport system permease protein
VSVRHDLRQGWRTFVAMPGVTLAAVLSLALGIGANTAIFSVASPLLLRPLPYAEPDGLAILWNRSPGLGIVEDWFSTAQYFDVRNSGTFADVALAIGANDNLIVDGQPERIGTIRLSSNLLPMLGVRPLLGRLFTADDDRAGVAGTALLGHGTWRRRFGSDPAAVGRSILVNGVSFRIVGVLPDRFTLPRDVLPTLGGVEQAELVLPLPLDAEAPRLRTREDYNILARLKPGLTIAEAQARMDALTARLRREHPGVYPPNGGLTFSVVPLHEQVAGDVRRPLGILLGAVGVVLLIACANVAHLLLARALGRRREMAVRAAIGASRGRLVRQLLVESLLLAAAGGLAGIAVAAAGVRAIHALGAGTVPRLEAVGLDPGVLAFTALITLVAGVLSGLAPAWRSSRLDLTRHLKTDGRGASGTGSLWRRGHGLRRLLVAGEIALAVVLLVGAVLVVRSVARLASVPPGFDPAGTLTFELTMQGSRYEKAISGHLAYRDLWQRIEALPGVTAAGAVSALPLSQHFAWGPLTVEGRTRAPGEAFLNADMRFVEGRYFEAMRIPLVDGRLFTASDVRPGPLVALVDTHMAAQLWPGQTAVGKRIQLGFGDDPKAPWITIVGVVGRVKQYALDGDSRIALYLAHAQFPVRAMSVVIRSDAEPVALTAAVRQALQAVDPNLPLFRVATMDARVGESLARRRFLMVLLTLFAGVACSLAMVGCSGVLACLVSQGTRDLAIRMALGATRRDVVRLVVGHGLAIAGAGIVAGLAAAALASRVLDSLLFEVRARDPWTFAAVAAGTATVAALASLTPAWRATRIDPVRALAAD